MRGDSHLFRVLPSRFEIIDQWLIHYRPLKTVNPQTSSVFLYFLEENAKRVRAMGHYPVLLMDLRHTVITDERQVVKVLSDGLYASYICAIAGYGLPHSMTRPIFSVTLRATKKIPGRFFESRADAESWLELVVDGIRNLAKTLEPTSVY